MAEYTFAQLVDIAQLRQLLETHHRLSGLAYSVVDAAENILVAVGWRDICTQFHRVHPTTAAGCRESDGIVIAHLHHFEGQYLEYPCKNGMIDVAMPIVIDGEHLATFFAGQFFYDDDRPGEEFFRKQADAFGFDREAYLKALVRVPVLARGQVRDNLNFLRELVQILMKNGHKFYALVREMEERRRSEQRLSLLGFALNKVSEAAFLIDEHSRFHYVNDEACRALGYSQDELLGMCVSDIDPDCPMSRFHEYWNATKTKGSCTFESRHRAKDKRIFPIELTVNYFEYEGRAYNLALVRDRSEHKRMEEALREEGLKFRTLAENIPDLIVRYDPDLRRIYVNPAWERASGLSSAEVVNIPIADIPSVPTPVVLAYREKLRRVLATGTSEEIDFHWMNACGENLFLRYVIVPEYDRHGKVASVLAAGHDLTERKRMEEELQISEERLRLTLKATQIGIWDWDLVNDRWYASSVYYSMLGYQAKAGLANRNEWLDRVHPEDRPYVSEILQGALARDVDEYCYEARLRHADGTYRWQHVQGISINRDEAGKVARMLGLRMDITARRLMEEQLRTRENQLSTLMDNMPDFISRFDTAGRHIYVNPPFTRAFDVTVEDVIGKSLLDPCFTCSEDNASLHAAILHAGATGAVTTIETSWITRDGVRNFEVRYIPEKDEGGAVRSVLSIARDITERKRIERQLQQQERQYRKLSEEFQTLLNGIPDLIIHLAPDMSITWANKATMDILENDSKGPYCYARFHGRTTACEQCPIIRAFGSGVTEEEVIVDRDGRHWGIKAFPLTDPQGRVLSVIEYASDITEKIRLREEASRNAQLAALGEIAAGVAHEINNPNGVILFNVDFLTGVFAGIAPLLDRHAEQVADFALAGVEFAEIREDLPLLLTETYDCALRIKRIVEDLKEFVQPIIEEETLFPLNAAVQMAVRLAANEIKKSTDCFQVSYGNGLPKVAGSRQAIEQVVINLLTNACQALPDRARSITVATRFDSIRGTVNLEVSDQGNGILPEDLPHITNPFHTTRRNCGGTGLGLAISARLIREHGGNIHFSSIPGTGTTVTVMLPADKDNLK